MCCVAVCWVRLGVGWIDLCGWGVGLWFVVCGVEALEVPQYYNK